MIQITEHRYTDGASPMIGHLVFDDIRNKALPGILIAPSFRGISDFEKDRARDLVAEGYVALVVDFYGDGRGTTNPDVASRWMAALNRDRPVLARRMNAALDTLKAQPRVDAARTGAIGYCLGGKAALDLARSGAAFQACVPIHGVFDPPLDLAKRYTPSILALHGWSDPLAPPSALTCLAEELTDHGADWQVLGFGHTGHAFTNPAATDTANHFAYSEASNRRAWIAMIRFLEECFSQ